MVGGLIILGPTSRRQHSAVDGWSGSQGLVGGAMIHAIAAQRGKEAGIKHGGEDLRWLSTRRPR